MNAAWSSFVDMQTIYIRSVSNAFGDTGKKAREYIEGVGFKKVALGVTIAAATVATAGAAGLAGVGSGFAGAVVGAAAGALVGGVMSGVLYELSGYGKFWDGFKAGAISGALAGGMAGFKIGSSNLTHAIKGAKVAYIDKAILLLFCAAVAYKIITSSIAPNIDKSIKDINNTEAAPTPSPTPVESTGVEGSSQQSGQSCRQAVIA